MTVDLCRILISYSIERCDGSCLNSFLHDDWRTVPWGSSPGFKVNLFFNFTFILSTISILFSDCQRRTSCIIWFKNDLLCWLLMNLRFCWMFRIKIRIFYYLKIKVQPIGCKPLKQILKFHNNLCFFWSKEISISIWKASIGTEVKKYLILQISF